VTRKAGMAFQIAFRQLVDVSLGWRLVTPGFLTTEQ